MTGAQRAKAYRDRKRTAGAGVRVPRPTPEAAPVTPPVTPPAAAETLAAEDMKPPPASLSDELPPDAAAAAAAAPEVKPTPEAAPVPPSPFATTIGQLYGAWVSDNLETTLVRYAAAGLQAPKPLAALCAARGALAAAAADGMTELCMRLNLTKPPPAVTVAVTGGLSAFGAYGPLPGLPKEAAASPANASGAPAPASTPAESTADDPDDLESPHAGAMGGEE